MTQKTLLASAVFQGSISNALAGTDSKIDNSSTHIYDEIYTMSRIIITCTLCVWIYLLDTSNAHAQSVQEIVDGVRQSYDKNFEPWTANLDIEAEITLFDSSTGKQVRVEKSEYTSSQKRFRLNVQIMNETKSQTQIWTGGPEAIYRVRLVSGPNQALITERQPYSRDLFHEVARADLGVAPQIADCEVAVFRLLALPDVKPIETGSGPTSGMRCTDG